MKSIPFFSVALLTLAALVSLTSLSALAMPDFPDGIELYESQDGGVYTTSWTAYPMSIYGYSGANYDQPDDMLIAISADGKTSNFKGVVSISCSSPTNSHIESSEDYTSLKVAMEEYIIPRPVVESLFAQFCD